MIRSHFHAGAAGRLDAGALDAALKSLYATGLFQDVKISQAGDRVLVTVVENPTIARLVFEGNKKIKDEDLKKALQSKDGGPLSRAIVHDDVEHIIALYRQRGYFDVRVEPKTIDAKHDRVNLVFEIKEGDKLAVKEIRFVGNKAFPQNKLAGRDQDGHDEFPELSPRQRRLRRRSHRRRSRPHPPLLPRAWLCRCPRSLGLDLRGRQEGRRW